MADDIIGMEDMMAVYEVTDRFGIDRESISVPLEKDGGGAVARGSDGVVEIIAPAVSSTRDWLPELQRHLERLGFEQQGPADGDWDA